MGNQNNKNGIEEYVPRNEGDPISSEYVQTYKLNITSEVAVSVKGISVTAKGYGQEETLKKVIRKNKSEYKTTLLIQISHCLLRLEENQTPLDELSPSEIFIQEKELANESSHLDIGTLAKTFYYILTGKELREGSKPVISENDCDDPVTAQDLIDQMIDDEDFTIQDILQHPFCWSKLDRIEFICEAYDRIEQEHEINVNDKHIIPESGWIEKLTLLDNEILDIRLKYPGLPIGIKTIKTICHCAYKKEEYNKKSILDLMQFFRHQHYHYWEKDRRIRIAFGDYNDGYWNFYQQRFPKLLIHVYDKTKCVFDKPYKNIAPFKYLQKE